MIATLRWIAVIGLGGGIASLAVAYALDGPNFRQYFNRADLVLSDCKQSPSNAAERHLAWNGGDTLVISLPARVHLHAGQGNDVVLRGSPDAIGNLELSGHRLRADCRWMASWRDIDVTLPANALRALHIAGAGNVELEAVNQPELQLKISGSGSVAGQGSVERLSIEISGSGDARLGGISAKQLSARVAGSGNVEAAPTDEANIRIAGSGNVRLLTRPAQLKTHVAGSGRIRMPGAEAADRKI
jgi:hypothetical protein